MESEEKFLIWTLFSLLPGFHAHIRADCSRPSCQLRDRNKGDARNRSETSVVVFYGRDEMCAHWKTGFGWQWFGVAAGHWPPSTFQKEFLFQINNPFFPPPPICFFFNFACASFSFHLPSPLTQLHLLSFCSFGHILPAVVSLCCSSSCSAATAPEGQTSHKQQVSSWWGCVFTHTHSETEK